MAERASSPPRAAGVIVWVLGALIVAALFLAVWVGVRGTLAQQHLATAQQIATGLDLESLTEPAAAADVVDRLGHETSEARALTSDPLWRIAEQFPWAGPQLQTVSTLSASIDETVRVAITPLVASLQEIGTDALVPRDGNLDAAAFATLQPQTRSTADVASDAVRAVEDIDRDPLLGALRKAVDDAREVLGSVASATDAFARATQLVPAMLGAEQPRNLLILFQNNAEWRSLGGLVGSMALLHAENGQIELAEQASAVDLDYPDEPRIAFDDELRSIYETRPGRYPGNVTQLADFSLAAELARANWAASFDTEADSVVAIDPVALSYILRAIGPVELQSGITLDSENLVDVLLNETYLDIEDPQAQNMFFDTATAAVFEAMLSRPLNPMTLLAGITQAGAENRLFIWNADPSEQAVLDGSSLQGALPTTNASTTGFGVYLNDGTGSKMDYYMSLGTKAGWCSESSTGPSTLALHVQLQNDAPDDAATLPRSITGGRDDGSTLGGVAAGVTRTITYIYLPEGATLVDQEYSSGGARIVGSHEGRQVVSWWSDAAPQESVTLDIRITTPHTRQIDIISTASINAIDGEELDISCVSAE